MVRSMDLIKLYSHFIPGVSRQAAAGFLLLTAFVFFSACSRTAADAPETHPKPLVTPDLSGSRPKIVALGDSLTAGFGLSEAEAFPYLLQEKLTANGYRYEVVDAGVSGDTSLGGLERADWVLGQDNAQILILELGANDLLRGMPVAAMKENLRKIIKKAASKGMKVLLCGMVAPPTMGGDYQRAYTNAFPDLADEEKVAFLPFLLDGVALRKELNQADGIHPNADGEKIMTENVYKALTPLLSK